MSFFRHIEVSDRIIMEPYCVNGVVMNDPNKNTVYADITNVETK